jgi:predicted Zn-dependent protease
VLLLFATAASAQTADQAAAAQVHLEYLLKLRPGEQTAHAMLAALAEAMGDTPRGVALLRQAILRDPHNVKLYLDFASLSFTHQSFQVGIDMINAGLTRAPDAAHLISRAACSG